MRVYTENDVYEFQLFDGMDWRVNENDTGWRTLVVFPDINMGLPMRLWFVTRGRQMTEDVIDVEYADD